jgi:hypothetical protein
MKQRLRKLTPAIIVIFTIAFFSAGLPTKACAAKNAPLSSKHSHP